MVERFGDFLILDIGELERDRFLSEDAPYLPSFEIVVSATAQPAAGASLAAFAAAVQSEEVRIRFSPPGKVSFRRRFQRPVIYASQSICVSDLALRAGLPCCRNRKTSIPSCFKGWWPTSLTQVFKLLPRS